VVGLDLSPQSIAYAKQFENDTLRFFVKDMREVFEVCCFDVILNLFTSFGYFEEKSQNLQVIEAAKKSLKPKGKLVIDFFNTPKILREMPPYELKEIEGISFHIHKALENEFVVKRILFEDKSQNFAFLERVKAIDYEEFMEYFAKANMKVLHLFGDYDLHEFDEKQSNRMIFILEAM
jgi:SAM-dependent methyltransferase